MKTLQIKKIQDERYKVCPDVVGVIKDDPMKNLSDEDKKLLKSMARTGNLDVFFKHLMDLSKSVVLQKDTVNITVLIESLYELCKDLSEFSIVQACNYWKKNNSFFPSNTAEFYQIAKNYNDSIKSDLKLYG